jgi:outer membrane protein OmpA-like peptidoglycan-associated protein
MMAVRMAGGIALALGMTWGCASAESPVVHAVKAEYSQAASNPQIAKYAPGQLEQAHDAVDRLDYAQKNRANEKEIEHLAYVARGRIEIARTIADEGALNVRVADLGKQRDQLLVATREAQEREVANAARNEVGRPVEFATDKHELEPGARDVLEQVAEALKEVPGKSIEVAGHTDSTGTAAHNKQLSERRAETVATYLEEKGVDPSRIQVKAYGESKPLAPNTNVAGRQQNRRVDIFLAQASPPAGSGSGRGR